jgi:1-acyl-sn-glycerol-3-phosphate acyltransferase
MFFTLHRHRVYGIENLPKGPALIAANHTSYYDPPLIAVSSPEELHFLAKDSLFKVPLFSSAIRALNAHPVSGTASDLASFKLICKLIAEEKKVVIFPEGRRSETNELLPIKPGIGMLAMRCDAPIVPTYISGLYDVWPMYNAIPKPWGKTTIHFGKPIDWHSYAHLDRKEAQQAIATDLYAAIEALRPKTE